jgi:hypothetical protein
MQRKLTFEELVKFGQSHNYIIKEDALSRVISWYPSGDNRVVYHCDSINKVFNEIANDISLKKNPTGERLKVIFPNE